MNNKQLDLVLEYLNTGIINEGLFDKFKKKPQSKTMPQSPSNKTLPIDQIEDEELKEQAKNIDKAIMEANKPFSSGKYNSQIKKLAKEMFNSRAYFEEDYGTLDEFIKWEISFDDLKIIAKYYVPSSKEVVVSVDLEGITQDGYFAIGELFEKGPYEKAVINSLRKNKITRFKELGFGDDIAGYTIILK
jgi:hypothetical protein